MDKVLAVIVFIIIVIVILNFYWEYILAVIGIIVFIFIFVKGINAAREEKARQQREKARQLELQEEEKDRRLKLQVEEENRQQGYYEGIITLGDESMKFFESAPSFLESAEKHLNQAELDFSEGVFAPFWDSIEKATNDIGNFIENINGINTNSSQHIELVKKYTGKTPKFPLQLESVKKLNASNITAKRLENIVRKSQKNFKFATIYEQRKTNQILVAGFGSLAEALGQMTSKINCAIDDLAYSVDSMAEKTAEQHDELMQVESERAERAAEQHDELMQVESERAERERETLEKLGNIETQIKK